MQTPHNAVGVQIQNHVATITFQRPERHNTLAKDLVEDLFFVLQNLEQNRDVRALILTGQGDKAFCAGADLSERKTMSNSEVKQTVHGLRKLTNTIAQFPKPTLAAINGYAFGGGLEIALACDLRLISDNAKVGLTETTLGIIPGAGGSQRLPRLIGIGRAKDMIFTGKRIDAKTAEAWQLVEYLCPQNELLARATEVAEQIAKAGPLAVEQAKLAIDKGIETDLQTGLAIEGAAYDTLIPTKDRVEALNAFAQKRPPQFQGE